MSSPLLPKTIMGYVLRTSARHQIGLAVLAVGVDGTVLSVALPTLSKALKTTESNLQWFSSGYFLVLAAAILSLMLLKSPGFRPSPISDQRIMSIGNCKLKS